MDGEQISFELMDLSQESMDTVWRFRTSEQLMSHAVVSDVRAMRPEEFYASFRFRFFQVTTLPPVFVVTKGKKIGYIRFRPHSLPDQFEISCLIESSEQGKGYGTRALIMAEEYAKRQGAKQLFGYIHPANGPSRHIFEKVGYLYEGEAVPYQSTDALLAGYNAAIPEPLLLFSKNIVSSSTTLESKPFIIAEIGSNWIVGSKKKNRLMAQRLIESASKAGCNAVKFQLFRASETYAKGSGKSDYLRQAGIDEEIYDVLHEHEVDFDDIPALYDMSVDYGLEFMSSSFSESTFRAIDPYVRRHKIASYEISDPVLLDLAAQSKKPVILSTGASTLYHIGWAVNRLRNVHPDCHITLLQCTSSYPTPADQANIYAMNTISIAFGVDVGLSDHTLDPCMAPLLATALGATVIEKHITLSRKLPGPDHLVSLEPDELEKMVTMCRNVHLMCGNGQKNILPVERELYSFAQRGLQAIRDIAINEEIFLGKNVAYLRPGTQIKGAHPIFSSSILGKKARYPIASGRGVGVSDVL